MSILKNGFDYGLRNKSTGFYLKFSNEDLQELKTLTPRQEKKFKRKKLMPHPLLQFFWDIGYLPIMKRPLEGMRVPAFLKLLSHGEYVDERHEYKGIWLRDKIETEEYPEIVKINEIYLKVRGDGHKRTPASYIRELPGTIIR